MVKLGDNPPLLPDNTGLTGTRASTGAGRGKLVVTKTYRKPSAHLPQRGLPAPAAFPRDFSTGARVSPKHRCSRAHGRANSPHLLNRSLGTKAGGRSLTGQRACPALAGALPQNCGRKGKGQGARANPRQAPTPAPCRGHCQLRVPGLCPIGTCCPQAGLWVSPEAAARRHVRHGPCGMFATLCSPPPAVSIQEGHTHASPAPRKPSTLNAGCSSMELLHSQER